MGRSNKKIYCFLADKNYRTYQATYNSMGLPTIVKNSQPTPLKYNPDGIEKIQLELQTNQEFFSMNRSVSYPLNFVKDGADIIRDRQYKGAGYEEEIYFIMIEWDSDSGYYKLAYRGKLDLSNPKDNKNGISAPSVDDSVWAVLSANKGVAYQIDCTKNNPAAIPVKFTGTNLENSMVFTIFNDTGQTSQLMGTNAYLVVGKAFLKNDGDSIGIVWNQFVESANTNNIDAYIAGAGVGNYDFYPSVILPAEATITAAVSAQFGAPGVTETNFDVLIVTSAGNTFTLIANTPIRRSDLGYTNISINAAAFNLAADEKAYLVFKKLNPALNVTLKFNEDGNQSFFSYRFLTKVPDRVCWGLRPLDLIQQIVAKATGNRYTIRSNYYEVHNKDILFGGDSLRQLANAAIYSSYTDWWVSFDSGDFLAMRIINGELWVEPATEVYKMGNIIMSLGEIEELEIMAASEYFGNEIVVGSPKQDYQRTNGRYEFNSINTFSLPVTATNTQKKISLESKYRRDFYGINFIFLDLLQKNSTDDLGDTDVFMVRITDEQDADGNYLISRPAYTAMSGVPDNTVANTELSPMNMIMGRKAFFASILYQQKNGTVRFETADKNGLLSVTLAGKTIRENADIPVASFGPNLFLPYKAGIKARVPDTFNNLFNNFNAGGEIEGFYKGARLSFLPIGKMSINKVTDEAQKWQLLFSPNNSLTTIAGLFNNNTFIQLMDNQLSISILNPLHFVEYNYTPPEKYNNVDMDQDLFENRFQSWANNPEYLQPWQKKDTFKIQLTVNGLNQIKLRVYRASDAFLLDTIDFNPVANPPIPVPDIVWEAPVNLDNYPEDVYFFTIEVAGTPVAISQRIETRDRWPGTLLMECKNSKNLPDAFFSTGFECKLRIEGLLCPWKPEDTESNMDTDEQGNNVLLNAVPGQTRKAFFGDGAGVPDFMSRKMNAMFGLDNTKVEGGSYVLGGKGELQPNEDKAWPMYYYQGKLYASKNKTGLAVSAVPGAQLNSVVIVVDALAFGNGGGGLVNIEITEE